MNVELDKLNLGYAMRTKIKILSSSEPKLEKCTHL